MTPEEFTTELRRAGFEQFAEVEWPANGAIDEHAHPFESRALILSGESTLTVAGREATYTRGEVFHLDHGALHQERYTARRACAISSAAGNSGTACAGGVSVAASANGDRLFLTFIRGEVS